jgi:hypothetical protein
VAHAITLRYFDNDNMSVYADDKKIVSTDSDNYDFTILATNSLSVNVYTSMEGNSRVLISVYDPINDTFYNSYLKAPTGDGNFSIPISAEFI